MDVFNLIAGIIVGFIFGMYMKEIKYLVYVILSCCTAFWFIKIFHPNIYILSIYEWSWQNIFDGYNFPLLFIVGFIISYIFFYWGIQKLLSLIIKDVLEKKYTKNMSKEPLLTAKKIKKILICIVKNMNKIGNKIDINPVTNKLAYEYEQSFSISKYKTLLINTFTISIHFYIIWFSLFPINSYFIVSSILVIILNIYITFYYPFIKDYFLYISKLTIHEHNRNK